MKTNAIYCGDCKKILINHIPDNSIDLIYVDLPFFSNRNYEVIWGDGYELRAFEDRWKGGIQNYIAWMEEKIRECHRVLKPTGSMYLHCNHYANAHLRMMLDRIFGENNFQNEIIWAYKSGGATEKRWSRKHDTIFYYTKSKKWTFNTIKEKSYNRDYKPYKFKGVEEYEDEIGWYTLVNMKDVWNINMVGRTAKERLGYPTQKPQALLERIIEASSNPTDIVLDPMCGCGTAVAVAHKLGRRWIGIDVSPSACRLMVKRLHSLGANINDNDIVGLPKTLDEIKTMMPFEFQNFMCNKLLARVSTKKSGDFGIDGWMIDGRPIQIKQSDAIGRNVVDNFETALKRVNRNRGIIIAFSFGKGAYEEVARAKMKDGIEIELKTVDEILSEN